MNFNFEKNTSYYSYFKHRKIVMKTKKKLYKYLGGNSYISIQIITSLNKAL